MTKSHNGFNALKTHFNKQRLKAIEWIKNIWDIIQKKCSSFSRNYHKNHLHVLIVGFILTLWAIMLMLLVVKKEIFDMNGFWGGFWTEIFVGGVFSIFAVIYSSYLYAYAKRKKYYEDIVDFIEEIKELRKQKKLRPEEAKKLIKNFSKTIPDEILAYTLHKNKSKSEEKTKCKICNLDAKKTKSGKCKDCRLDCQAWE